MKKKVLLSSILTIVLCFSLIAGSTFALFTSKTEFNVAVTAGKVELASTLTLTKLESVKGDPTGTIVDENGATYSYETVAPTFTNGGTAVVDGAVLTLTNITPGDKVTFEVAGANNSNVAIQYRYVIECLEGYQLMSGLIVTVGTDECTSLASYTSPWTELTVGSDMATLPVTIELPVTAGNEYQETSTEIRIVVEAVQGNAVVDDNTAPVIKNIATVSDATGFAAALADPTIPAVNIVEDLALTVGDIANKTIEANGNDVSLTFTGTMENVVVKGIVAETAGNKINVSSDTAIGDITIVDCVLKSASSTDGVAIRHGAGVDMTIDNCTILAGDVKGYAIYHSGESGSLIITNSTLESFKSWVILLNETVEGDLIIDNCIFNTNDGVLKTLGGGVTGDFTFTNNTMTAAGHDGNIAKLVVSGNGSDPVVVAGTKTVANNTLNGADWIQ